jgi:Protein of unknown function (DUF3300)
MLLAGLFAVMLAGNVPELMIPEGTILPVVLNETLNTAKLQDNDPILLSIADDVRTAGHRGAIVIPRGSSVVGRIVKSQRAGHFVGRSELNIVVQEIMTPSGEVYDGVSAKIVDIAKKKGEKGEVKPDGGIRGPSHAGRDAFLLLFPPTTLFQLIATPRRGPDVVLPVETRLYVKLMTPIYVETLAQLNTAAAPQRAMPLPLPQPVPQVYPQAYPTVVPQVLPSISASGLEILVSPIALYPDPILRDVFMACTHPLDLVQANQWVHQNRDPYGSLPRAGYNQNWDSSVRALTGYPDLLQRLSGDLTWMTKIGSAFSSQPADVMGAVERLRIQATAFRAPYGIATLAGR